MNSKEYKSICKAPNSFNRNALEITVDALNTVNQELARKVQEQLSKPPIEKPINHKGGPETDFFIIDISKEDVDEIMAILISDEAGAVSSDGETTPEASHLATLTDQWGRLRIYKEENDNI